MKKNEGSAVTLSDEDRIAQVAQALKRWQRGSFLCIALSVSVLAVAVFLFQGGAAGFDEDLEPLEFLPENRMSDLITKIKGERKESRALSKELASELSGENAKGVVLDARWIVQNIEKAERDYRIALGEYGKAMEAVTRSIGGVAEWNYNFQESLTGYEENSRARLAQLSAILDDYPEWIDQ
ncbi:MAG: hypothetical protein ACRBCS_00085 [Cellvibrionaceae bacterium]